MSAAEQKNRRAMLYDKRVVPVWADKVDHAMLELLQQVDLGDNPTLLAAEARTGHLVETVSDVLPDKARLMVVDPSSEMLDRARKRLQDLPQRLFYSSQSMTRLSYADGVFHAVLCTNGILTRSDLKLAGNELLRVLRPQGFLGLAVPLNTTFDSFPYMLRESALRMEMRDVAEALDKFEQALVDTGEVNHLLEELDLEVLGTKRVAFDLTFDDAEDFLFSPFVEGTYLPRWLAVCSDPAQREPLFFDIVRSINTYFRGLSFDTTVELDVVLATRQIAG